MREPHEGDTLEIRRRLIVTQMRDANTAVARRAFRLFASPRNPLARAIRPRDEPRETLVPRAFRRAWKRAVKRVAKRHRVPVGRVRSALAADDGHPFVAEVTRLLGG